MIDPKMYMLKSIKRTKKPLINEGDVFAVQIPEGQYLHGRVIKTGLAYSDNMKLSVIFPLAEEEKKLDFGFYFIIRGGILLR